MKSKLYSFVTASAFLLSACATPNAIKQDSEVAWEDTKKVSSEVWDETKKVSTEVWGKTTEVTQKTWQDTQKISEESYNSVSGQSTAAPVSSSLAIY